MKEMGITRISNLTGLDRVGVPVVAVTRPNSRSVAVALGKGFTLGAAKASGVMEAIESFHAEHIDKPLLLSSYERLQQRARVIDLEQLPRVSVGALRAGQKLLWVEGRELSRDEECWIPYEVVHSDYTLPFPTGSGAFLMSSNGIASGNHLTEAISHGICEVVERDATALWMFSTSEAQARTRVDLRSINDELCLEVLQRFARAEVKVTVWDITTDVNIPCFRCQVEDAETFGYEPLHPVAGYGCHPRREVALMRALTEAAQARLTIVSGARDDLSQTLYDGDPAPRAARKIPGVDHVSAATRHFEDAPSCNAPTVEDDVQWELSQLASAGFCQVAVVDLTKPEFGIPVVRVVIPGLESICEAPGYVPGVRLRSRLEQLR
jgi:ribosomal protein S12 methylthiotransferase accessory factor